MVREGASHLTCTKTLKNKNKNSFQKSKVSGLSPVSPRLPIPMPDMAQRPQCEGNRGASDLQQGLRGKNDVVIKSVRAIIE